MSFEVELAGMMETLRGRRALLDTAIARVAEVGRGEMGKPPRLLNKIEAHAMKMQKAWWREFHAKRAAERKLRK